MARTMPGRQRDTRRIVWGGTYRLFVDAPGRIRVLRYAARYSVRGRGKSIRGTYDKLRLSVSIADRPPYCVTDALHRLLAPSGCSFENSCSSFSILLKGSPAFHNDQSWSSFHSGLTN